MRDKEAEKRYIRERAKGKSIRKAAAAAKVAPATAMRAEYDPRIRSAMARALERAGCTEDKIAEVVKRNLDAQKVISADFVEVPDGPTQLKAAELAGKFRGDFTEKVEHSGQISVVETVNYAAIAEVAPKLPKP